MLGVNASIDTKCVSHLIVHDVIITVISAASVRTSLEVLYEALYVRWVRHPVHGKTSHTLQQFLSLIHESKSYFREGRMRHVSRVKILKQF